MFNVTSSITRNSRFPARFSCYLSTEYLGNLIKYRISSWMNRSGYE